MYYGWIFGCCSYWYCLIFWLGYISLYFIFMFSVVVFNFDIDFFKVLERCLNRYRSFCCFFIFFVIVYEFYFSKYLLIRNLWDWFRCFVRIFFFDKVFEFFCNFLIRVFKIWDNFEVFLVVYFCNVL